MTCPARLSPPTRRLTMKTQQLFPAIFAIGFTWLTPLSLAGDLKVEITGIRTDKGSLMVSVVNSEAGWNNQEKPVAAQKVTATGKETVLHFNLPAGSYAVQVM